MRKKVLFGLTILLFIIFASNTIAAYTWSTTTPLPVTITNHGSAVYNQHLYVVSGYLTDYYTDDSTVYVGHLNTNGTIGSWNTTTYLPQNLEYIRNAVFADNGNLYVMGGEDENSLIMNPYVYKAAINPDGSLGTWAIASPPLPHGGNDCHSGAIYNGYIYDIAGECYDISSGGYYLTNQVYYAKISTNGNIGAWTETTPVPFPTWFGTAVAMNGYMIFYSGATAWASASYNINQNVYVAPINGDGSLGSWVLQTTQMPFPVYDSAGVGGGNKIFSIAGRTVGSVRIDTTYWAPVIGGTVGTWVVDTNYLNPVAFMPAAVGTAADGQQRIYCSGGSQGGGIYLDIVGVSSPITAADSTPIISVIPSSINFGAINVGSSIDSIVRISNAGFGTLTVSNITITGLDFSRFWPGTSSLTAGQYIEATVRFNPTAAITRNGILTIISNSYGSPTVNVSLTGIGAILPDIDIQPASFTKNITQGQILYDIMTIRNTQSGSSSLTWQITESLTSTGGMSILDAGGPDIYGYRWIDSDSSGGPTYSWIDITSIGTQITGLGDDYNSGSYPIGFTFPFYGADYSSFRLCSNGWISFSSYLGTYSNTTLPNTYAPFDLVAPFWDDLDFTYSGSAYYYSDGNRLIVSYLNIPPYSGSGTYTFQIILYPSGEMVYQYQSLTGITNGCTVGIQNSDGTDGLQVAYNESYLHDAMALRFYRDNISWLDQNPKSESTAALSYSLVTVTFDATELPIGDTTGYIKVSSNDSDESILYIPVTLHVLPGAPQLNFSPDTVNFGALYIGASIDSVVRVENNGYGILTVSNISVTGSDYSRIGSGNIELTRHQYENITVQFAPSVSGVRTGMVTVSSNDTGSSDTTVYLTGMGLIPPDIAVVPSPIPTVTVMQGNTTYSYLTISNTGGADLTYTIRDAESMATTASIKSLISQTASNIPKSFTIQPGAEYVKDELLVKFKPSASLNAMNSINTEIGIKQIKTYSKIGVSRLKITSGKSVTDAIAIYAKYPGQVEFAEPNYIVHINRTPNDPSYSQLWGMNNTGQTGGTPDADIDAPEAWNIGIGNPNVIIGVIDSGVDYTHPDLMNNIWHNPSEIPFNSIDDDGNGYVDDTIGWDFVNNDNNPMDDNSHGSHCSGTIAGEGDNSIGVVGVMWHAKIMPLKFLDASGSGATADAVDAVLYAAQMGVKLTSNSWGGGGYSSSLYAAISVANAAGQLFVAAAGNSASNNDSFPSYPASYDLPNIIAIAATDHNDNLASFSNYGPISVDVAAPGVNIYSTTPGGGYGTKSGTSMACPHVAGACGLIWSANLAFTNTEVKQILLNSVDVLTSLTGKCATNGRINIYKALQIAGLPWLDENPKSGTIAGAGYSCITVIYDATELPIGDTSGYIIINSNDPDENPVNVLASVHVIAGPPSISITPIPVDFGSVFLGSSSDKPVRITNTGYGTLTVSNVTITGSDYTRFWSGSIQLTRNMYADITVRFAPTAIGSRTGSVSIYSNISTVVVNLSGTGVTPPEIAIQPSSFEKTIYPGTIVYDIMTVRNTAVGSVSLDWLISESLTTSGGSGLLAAESTPIEKPASPEFSSLMNSISVNLYEPPSIDTNSESTVYPFTPEMMFASDAWSIRQGMNTARYRAAAAAVDGKVYIIGGLIGSSGTNSVEMYNPTTNTWSTKASMPVALGNICCAAIGTKIYVAGGYSTEYFYSTLQIYDTQYNTWTTGASLPQALAAAAAAAVNGKLYVIGGGTESSLYNTCYEYNPDSNTWATKASMSNPRVTHGAAVVNNKIYVVGGYYNASLPYCEEYNPTSNTWTTKAPLNLGRSGLGVASDGTYIYAIGGGQMWTNETSACERYNPVTNTWINSPAEMPYLNVARESLSVAVNNGTIYALAGFVSGNMLNTNESYDADMINWLDETGKSGAALANSYSIVTITFDATNLPIGDTTGYIKVGSNDPNDALVYVPVILHVYAGGTAGIAVTPTYLNYGTVRIGNNLDKQIRITNNGYGILTVNNITATGDYGPIWSGDIRLGHDQYADVLVRFTPIATGSRPGVLSISSNAPSTPLVTILLSGTGSNLPTFVPAEVWRKY